MRGARVVRRLLFAHGMRLVILGVLLAACGDGDSDPPWDPGEPLPASCERVSALESTIAGDVFMFEGTSSSASRGNVWIASPTLVDQPWHTLTIQDGVIEAGVFSLPDDQVRLIYSMNPNGTEATENINVDTSDPAASNWYQAEVDGTVAFEEAGVQVGERRCGWFDVTFRWTPVGDSARSVWTRGTFDAVVEEIIYQ